MNLRLPRLFLSPYRPLDRPRYPVDRSLVSKQLAAAARLGDNSIKPVIEDHPDEFVTPAVVPEERYW